MPIRTSELGIGVVYTLEILNGDGGIGDSTDGSGRVHPLKAHRAKALRKRVNLPFIVQSK